MADKIPSSPRDHTQKMEKSSALGGTGDIKDVLSTIEQPKEFFFEPFFEEIKTNILNDIEDLQATFFQERVVKNITKIEITKAGDETHYHGKVAVFLEFHFQNGESVKLVYKPRSLKPDITVETQRHTLNPLHNSRKMLGKKSLGYDSFVKGLPLLYLTEIAANIRIQEQIAMPTLEHFIKEQKHLDLFNSLSGLGVEDLYPGNFLYNQENDELHFIDAECYQTGVALNLDELLRRHGITIHPISEKEILREEATRLVFCKTEEYQRFFTLQSFDPDPVFFIEDGKCFTYHPTVVDVEGSKGEKERCFLDYHDALFLQFLHVNKFFMWGKGQNRDISNKDICQLLKLLIGHKGRIFLENTVEQVNICRDEKQMDEIPSFHFNFKKNTVTCDFLSQIIEIRRTNPLPWTF